MTLANLARGEVPIELFGTTYIMAGTPSVIDALERRHDSVVRLLTRFHDGQWAIREMVSVVQIALAHERDLSPTDIREAILRTGPLHYLDAVQTLLFNILTGGQEPDLGNRMAADGETSTSPSAASADSAPPSSAGRRKPTGGRRRTRS